MGDYCTKLTSQLYTTSHKQKTPGDRGLLLGIRFNIL